MSNIDSDRAIGRGAMGSRNRSVHTPTSLLRKSCHLWRTGWDMNTSTCRHAQIFSIGACAREFTLNAFNLLRKRFGINNIKIVSSLPMYRWASPHEDERQAAARNWRKAIKIAVEMGVDTLNSEFGRGSPHESGRYRGDVNISRGWRPSQEPCGQPIGISRSRA